MSDIPQDFSIFSNQQLIENIKAFFGGNMLFARHRSTISGSVGSELLSSEEERFAKELRKRIIEEWKQPIENLSQSGVNNKHRIFFLRVLGSVCETNLAELINTVTQKNISVEGEKIVFFKKLLLYGNLTRVKFFIDNERIKMEIFYRIDPRNPPKTVKEVRKLTQRKRIIFLDENA